MSHKKVQPKLTHHELAVLSERSKKFDPNATSDSCIEDLRQLQGKNPNKSITRNFYRIHGKYSDSTWNQFFGTFHEFRRQAGLELSRDQHSLERKIAKHASLDIYREFYREEVLPYHNKYELCKKNKRFKTLLVGSDFHDIEVDPFVLSVFIDTAKRLQPDVIVLNGDLFDNPEFSRFDTDPRDFKIRERFDFAKKHFFRALRMACPDSQIDFIAGNHETRILKVLANKTPAMKVLLSDVMGLSLSDVFGLDEFEINFVCKLDLAAFSQNEVNEEVRENFKVYFESFVAAHIKDYGFGLSGTSGHTHRPELVTFRNIPMGKCSWVTTGCLAKTRSDYVEGMDNAMNSFMIAHIDTEKKFVSPEHILIPGDSVVVHGKRYERKNK